MKLVNSVWIVQSNNHVKFIGITLEGKAREFGGITDDITRRDINAEYLINSKFENSQIRVRNRAIQTKGKFTLRDLGLTLLYRGNPPKRVDVENKIELVGRIVQDNAVIGYGVKIGDKITGRYKMDSIFRLSKWMKPVNFIVKTSEKNKAFLTGKGMKLEDLPAIRLVSTKEENSKIKQAGAKKTIKSASLNPTQNRSTIDLMTIYRMVAGHCGYIVNFPNEEYIPTSDKVAVSSKKDGGSYFTPINIGDIAKPTIKYNNSKINAEIGFRRWGTARIMVDETPIDFDAYLPRSKNIVYNGKQHIENMGLLLPPEAINELRKMAGTSMSITEMDNQQNSIKMLKGILGLGEHKFYKLEAGKVEILSAEHRRKAIIPNDILYIMVNEYTKLRLQCKFLSPQYGILKELKAEMGNERYQKCFGRNILPAFAKLDANQLKEVVAGGLDVYSNIYKKVVGYADNAKKPKDKEVEIEYKLVTTFDGTKRYIDELKVRELKSDNAGVPDYIKELRDKIDACKTPEDKVAYCNTTYNTLNAELEKYQKALWEHKYSMYIDGVDKIHTHDAQEWKKTAEKNLSKGNVKYYENVSHNDLVLVCSNTEI